MLTLLPPPHVNVIILFFSFFWIFSFHLAENYFQVSNKCVGIQETKYYQSHESPVAKNSAIMSVHMLKTHAKKICFKWFIKQVFCTCLLCYRQLLNGSNFIKTGIIPSGLINLNFLRSCWFVFLVVGYLRQDSSTAFINISKMVLLC